MPGPTGNLSLLCKWIQLLADHCKPRPAVFQWPITGHLERCAGPAPENQQVPGLHEVQLEDSNHANGHQQRHPREGERSPPMILANPVVLSPVSFSHALSQHGYSQKRSFFSSLQVKQTHAAHTHLFGPQQSRWNPHILLLLRWWKNRLYLNMC